MRKQLRYCGSCAEYNYTWADRGRHQINATGALSRAALGIASADMCRASIRSREYVNNNHVRRQSKHGARSCRWLAVLLLATSTACGLSNPSEYVVTVDDIVVDAPSIQTDSISVRFIGYVGTTGCQTLNRTERLVVHDSLRLRFIAIAAGRLCSLKPIPLLHIEKVASVPARTVTLVALQPNGGSLVKIVRLPLR